MVVTPPALATFQRIQVQFVVLLLLISSIIPRSLFASDESAPATAKKAEAVENPFPKRHPAPELDGGVEWLNAAGPISVKDLRGKIVLIDFWTFCCINCMHVLPDLAYLEKKFPNELVVIGVHSAKFDNEKETGNIRKAILRYEIEHPVVNDANMTIWRKFGVGSWPTLVVLDPEGQYCGYISGEGNRELLEKVIERLIEYHKAKGTLDTTPMRFDLERYKAKASPLKFPGKLLVDEKGGRLFVSDSNNNRIVVSSLDGKLIDVIGTGEIGHQDGDFTKAQFDHPQGLLLVGQTLYVADTENHLIRTVDLGSKQVSTLAGTGEQDRTRVPGGELRETPLNSPWDLAVVDGVLYVAMAGPHQIWAHKLGSKTIRQYAGSGREDIRNGSLAESALAQPSGIVEHEGRLYVVDSEGSAIRQITTESGNDLESPTGKVTTIAGTHDLPRGRSLFEFGDVDATGDEARFQHPLGLTYHDGALYVADSYNHKIRRIDLTNHEVTTWAGTGKSGSGLAPLELSEPAGLAIAGGKMYVADTNNHRIVVIDIATKEAREFTIAGLEGPKSTVAVESSPLSSSATVTELDRQELKSGNSIRFEIQFELPDEYKLNPEFPAAYQIVAEGTQELIAPDQLGTKQPLTLDKDVAKIELPTKQGQGEANLRVVVTFGYCREGNGGACKVGSSAWKIPVSLRDGATQERIELKAKPAR